MAAVLVPLWASYLVKAYAWRTMLQPDGVFDSAFGTTPGFGLVAVVLTLTYLWLPYMILPVYSGFERLPEAHPRGLRRPRGPVRGDLPAGRPAGAEALDRGGVGVHLLASLGDYIAVQIVGGKLQMLGTAVLQNIVLDLPFAAALGTASVVIMVIYLTLASRTGALDNL